MIALMKTGRKGEIDKPVMLFNDYHSSGRWADNYIKEDHEFYYFHTVDGFNLFYYKVLLFIHRFHK